MSLASKKAFGLLVEIGSDDVLLRLAGSVESLMDADVLSVIGELIGDGHRHFVADITELEWSQSALELLSAAERLVTASGGTLLRSG